MAGIGEASAIISIVQVGFSLATALNTYVSDVVDARDDILSLTSDIDSTLGQLKDLGKLIDKNEITRAWSAEGVRNASKCVRDCENIIFKLRKLLQKATSSALSGEVAREDIDVSKFEKIFWPIFKPQLEVRRAELRSIKQDIMIAYQSYMTKAGETLADRKRANEDLPQLQRTRELIRKQVREARRRRRVMQIQEASKSQVSVHKDRAGFYAMDSKHTRSSGHGFSQCASEIDENEIEEALYANREDLERDFEDWATEKEAARLRQEMDRKMIEEQAVERWKTQQQAEADALRDKIETERRRLKEELERQRLSPKQISETLDRLYPVVTTDQKAMTSTVVSLQSSMDGLTVAESPTSTSQRRSVWSKFNGSARQSASTIAQTSEDSIPLYLKDPSSTGGIAHLEAFYYQRFAGTKKYSIRKIRMALPDQFLMEALLKQQPQPKSDKINPIWRDFAGLPEDYQDFITDDISEMNSATPGESWDLVHVEGIPEKSGPFRLSFRKSLRKECSGVYVVVRRSRQSQSMTENLIGDDVATDLKPRLSTTGRVERHLADSSRSVRSSSIEPRRQPSRSSHRHSRNQSNERTSNDAAHHAHHHSGLHFESAQKPQAQFGHPDLGYSRGSLPAREEIVTYQYQPASRNDRPIFEYSYGYDLPFDRALASPLSRPFSPVPKHTPTVTYDDRSSTPGTMIRRQGTDESFRSNDTVKRRNSSVRPEHQTEHDHRGYPFPHGFSNRQRSMSPRKVLNQPRPKTPYFNKKVQIQDIDDSLTSESEDEGYGSLSLQTDEELRKGILAQYTSDEVN